MPYGTARILWKESGTGVKWAVVRLSDRPRFAVFELDGTWTAATPEPTGWMKMTGCRPVFYFSGSYTYAVDNSEPTETVWHMTGYPRRKRVGMIALHQPTAGAGEVRLRRLGLVHLERPGMPLADARGL